MEGLIELLHKIDDDDTITARYGFMPEINNNGVRNASILAAKILITDEGDCNWRNIELLKLEGFAVFPIEKDVFGWLVGGIQLRKGIITFC